VSVFKSVFEPVLEQDLEALNVDSIDSAEDPEILPDFGLEPKLPEFDFGLEPSKEQLLGPVLELQLNAISVNIPFK
jgi:hypothetical protein